MFEQPTLATRWGSRHLWLATSVFLGVQIVCLDVFDCDEVTIAINEVVRPVAATARGPERPVVFVAELDHFATAAWRNSASTARA